MLGKEVLPRVKGGDLPYVLLGDDILIYDDALAAAYKTFLSDVGVEWSPAKTYTSTEMCEFAKRIFYRGVEVTPFPVSAMVGAMGNPILLASTLVSETRKGLVPRSGIAVSVRKLKGIIDPTSPSSIRRRWGR